MLMTTSARQSQKLLDRAEQHGMQQGQKRVLPAGWNVRAALVNCWKKRINPLTPLALGSIITSIGGGYLYPQEWKRWCEFARQREEKQEIFWAR